MDGVDAVLVSIKNDSCEMLAHHFVSMPQSLKVSLEAICMGQTTHIAQIGELDHRLGHLYADAVDVLIKKVSVQPSDISAIGNHGQTVYHHPDLPYPYTVQLGDANIIAARTGITTIADFRRKDMALGGQGAPLVPAFHRYLFKEMDALNVVLNIGGIANISIITADDKVTGFDTGPGNTLLDAWCLKHLGQDYDKDAEFAQKGAVNEQLLASLLSDSYFSREAPKSTGREYFNLDWLSARCEPFVLSKIKAEDVQATLLELTVRAIATDLKKIKSWTSEKNLYVCGGGVHNPLMMNRLSALLSEWEVYSTQKLGISPDYMEAIAFAWLAYRKINHLPSNLPSVTGACRPASLGVIYLAD